jgi:hypothetical protein
MSKIKTIHAKGIRWLVWSIYFIMIATIILAWIFYPERYNFFHEETSILGGIHASYDKNLSNFPSTLIFSLGFGLLGGMAIFTAIVYFLNSKRFHFAIIKGIMLIIVGIGSLGITVPYDFVPYNIIHESGAFLFLAGLAVLNFVFQLLHTIRRYNPRPPVKDLDYYVDYTFVVIFLLAVIVYFVSEGLAFFLPEIPSVEPATTQKIVLFTAIIAAGLLDLDDIK